MSYILTVTNNSPISLAPVLHPGSIPPKATWQSPVLGNEVIETTIAGRITFQDVANGHVPGDTSSTWGVLIRYGTEAIVGRYEGGGQLSVTFDQFLQVKLGGNMSFRQVQLDYLRF
jgi:hypothetical protein